MSVTGQNIINEINAYVRNYPPEAFHNNNLNRILQQMIQLIESGGGGGGGSDDAVLVLTSADFINATDCPLVAMDGINFCLFWNDIPRFIAEPDKASPEFSVLVGGGFKILIAGFDATANDYNIYLYKRA